MRTTLRTAALVPVLFLVLATAAAAGPPWIAIEYPANPHDPATRDALMVVRTYHHEAGVHSRVTAEARTEVDGRARTVALEVRATSRPGVYAVHGDLDAGSPWVVSVTRQGEDGGNRATALVAVSGEGEVMSVRVPSYVAEGRWIVPRDPTVEEREAMLRTAQAMDDAARSSTALGAAGAALILLLMPAAWLTRRRRDGYAG